MKKKKKSKLKSKPKRKAGTKPKAKKVAAKMSRAPAEKPLIRKFRNGPGIKGNQFQHFANILNQKRADILHTVEGKKSELTDVAIGDEADVATQTFEREMMFEVTNSERVVLDEIEAALRRIEKNDFGTCEFCHKKISAVRLNAMPWARYCIECQVRIETPA